MVNIPNELSSVVKLSRDAVVSCIRTSYSPSVSVNVPKPLHTPFPQTVENVSITVTHDMILIVRLLPVAHSPSNTGIGVLMFNIFTLGGGTK